MESDCIYYTSPISSIVDEPSHSQTIGNALVCLCMFITLSSLPEALFHFLSSKSLHRTESIFFLKVRLNVCKGSVPTNKLATAAQYQGAFTVTESRETRKTKVSVKFHHNLQRIVAALDAYTRLKVQDQEYL